MRLLSKIPFAVLAVAVFGAPASAQPLPAAQQVVDRYVEAVGGRDKVASIQSRRVVYRLSANGMTLESEAIQRRPGLGATIVRTPMGDSRSGFDGRVAWMTSPAGAQILEGAEAEEVRIRSAFDADVLFDAYETVETTGRAEYAGKACWKVRMVTAAGIESFRCFDVETGLMVAYEATQNGMPVVAIYDEYREFDGLKYPSRLSTSAMGQQFVTTLVRVEHVDIPASAFVPPDAVRALRRP